MILNFGCLALWLLTVQLRPSVADPKINENESENQKYDVSSAVTKMTSHIPLNDTLGWKQLSYLQKYPRNFDVTFSVGPEKIIVKALRIALTSLSSVFEREFEGRWQHEGEGIPLPDLDPVAFKLFVELMILDSWSVDALKALDLSSNQLLHLMSICHKYGMTTALRNLTELAKDFLKDFGTLVKPEDFLLLSQPQLEAILASEELPMTETDVYHYACRWAKEQCKKQNLAVTGENMRKVLGNCVYQIRFPAMSVAEFSYVTQLEGLLSLKETVDIFRFIGMDNKDNKSNVTTELKFKVEKRKGIPFASVPRGSSRISVTQVHPIIDTPFVCDGSAQRNEFYMNMTITLLGVGFVGPIDADSFYNVTIKIQKYTGAYADYTSKMEKRIFAQKLKTFYFIFDSPIALERITLDNWRNAYQFLFTLQGPRTQSLQDINKNEKIYDNENEFVIAWHSAQLVEILYKTV